MTCVSGTASTIFDRPEAGGTQDAKAKAPRSRGTRHRFRREPRPRSASAAEVRCYEWPDDVERSRARRRTPARGAFVATDGKLFTLTPHVLTLAASYLRSSQVVSVLQPVLDRIAAAAQEISSLAVLDGDEVVFIARGSPMRVFSTGLDIGYRLPAFCTSVGRAMLGQLDNAELAAKLAAMRRETMTSYTVTDPELLLATIIADREK